jgi:hypothetical protein
MSDTRQDGYSRFAAIIISAFTTILVAMAGQGVLAWRDIAVLNHSVEELVVAYHANSAYSDERGRKMEARISELETQLRLLQNQPASRADPFTGSQGRELMRRIDALEGR